MPKKPPCLALTGGGTAGHVSSHIALLPYFRAEGWRLIYLGAGTMEKRLIEPEADIDYFSISAGKLRRYFSIRNFFDIFLTLWGIIKSLVVIYQQKPSCLLSRGGYVSFPPAVACWLCRVPVVVLEADVSPGLATKMSFFFAKKLLYSFKETKPYIPKSLPSDYTGLPIKQEILSGDPQKGFKICQFDNSPQLPVLCVMGGSSGSLEIARLLARDLALIVQDFKVVVLTGSRRDGLAPITSAMESLPPQLAARVVALPFVTHELKHIYAASDFALSRAGANSLFELSACQIQALYIPLEMGSRGEQVENAEAMAKQGYGHIVRAKSLTSPGSLHKELMKLMSSAKNQNSPKKTGGGKACERVIATLKEYLEPLSSGS